ncbi:MAG: hypothetical protein KQA41_01485 [Candidatus Aenigmarchaeota archaeon]|nr:hypothetical protein [Candidatus Aenigmarchaeota archaeon]MBU5688880.1 hypothetical protein [Candidatus Aenigmarchaeota archaeon]
MDYVVTIPTTRERGAEVYRCLYSIFNEPTYQQFPIIVFGQTDDPTIAPLWRDIFGFNNIFYFGPDNMKRIILLLNNKLCFNRQKLEALFNFRTYGGARNLLTALAVLFCNKYNVGVINLDDDEEVKEGFFKEHIRLLGTTTNKGKKITLVTGPYENHDSYVGIETLINYLKNPKNSEIENIIRAITPAKVFENFKYGIEGARGGNLSRCDEALLIPYISSITDISMRGEDEIQAYLNQKMNSGCINVYTPNARVIHRKRPGYIVDVIKGEIIGIIVERVVNKLLSQPSLPLDELKQYIREQTEGVLKDTRERISKAARCYSYKKNKTNSVKDILKILSDLLKQEDFFVEQTYNHIDSWIFARDNWKTIIEYLANVSCQQKNYLLGLFCS